MPVIRLLLVLPLLLALSGPAAYAQQPASARPAGAKPGPPPRRGPRVLTVHLPMPPLMARLGEAAGLLERPATGKRRTGPDADVPDDPVLVFTLPLPKLFSSRSAETPAPATP